MVRLDLCPFETFALLQNSLNFLRADDVVNLNVNVDYFPVNHTCALPCCFVFAFMIERARSDAQVECFAEIY